MIDQSINQSAPSKGKKRFVEGMKPDVIARFLVIFGDIYLHLAM